ncbi:MAG: 3-methyl-2-oxobutanoate hydroxymethyltransferase [Pseudomonadota bacterium]
MSATGEFRRPTAQDIRARKGGERIVVLTAYTTPLARIADRHCDVLLVGDSVGMVVHGLPSTLQVTLEMMRMHGQAVARGATRSHLVIDLPFGSYEEGPEQAFRNASGLMRDTGAHAVKLEGGVHMAETIRFLTARGVPVMAHVGLTPQSINTLGGYRVQGRGPDAGRIREDARAAEAAGAYSIVLEKVPEPLAADLTQMLRIPTIGIGASAACDGQVLVIDDMLGLFTDFKARFVRRFAELGAEAEGAIAAYAQAVRDGTFPADEHVYRDSTTGP